MKTRFTAELFVQFNAKKYSRKCALIPKEQYKKLINDINNAKTVEKKNRIHYYLLQKYDVLTCGDVQKVIRKQTSANETPKYFVPLENMFDIIKRAHTATGHGGRDQMCKEI